jgi:hypothetical protein
MLGDNLYVAWTGNFVRDEWLNALGRGANQAMPMVYLAQAEMAVLEGIFVPWHVLLGVGAVRTALFYHQHKDLMNKALQKVPTVIRLFNEFKTRYPGLWSKLMTTAGREILSNLPSCVTLRDAGFLLGRLIRGVNGLPQVTLGILLRIFTVTTTLVAATHLPAITARSSVSI